MRSNPNCRNSLTCTGVTRNIATDVTRRHCVLIKKASPKVAFLIKEPELKRLLEWSATKKSAQFWDMGAGGPGFHPQRAPTHLISDFLIRVKGTANTPTTNYSPPLLTNIPDDILISMKYRKFAEPVRRRYICCLVGLEGAYTHCAPLISTRAIARSPYILDTPIIRLSSLI